MVIAQNMQHAVDKEEGAFVILSDRHERRLNESADQIAEVMGERPPVVVCDVTDQAMCAAAMAAIIREFGGIDVLVNNAGITRDQIFMRMSDEDWQTAYDESLAPTTTKRITTGIAGVALDVEGEAVDRVMTVCEFGLGELKTVQQQAA